MKALLFAAGLGTRLKTYTHDKPKALVTLAGKPLLQHAIEHLKSFGINEITINVFHFAEQIIEFINQQNSFGIKINISDEREQLLDTGGGLKKAEVFLNGTEPILIYNLSAGQFRVVLDNLLYIYHLWLISNISIIYYILTFPVF